MLTVTTSARSKIQDDVPDDDLPLRLEPAEDGSFRLTPCDWRSGDMSFAFDGSALLVVRGDLARRLSEWALELDLDANDLKARRQVQHSSVEHREAQPEAHTRPVELATA